MTDDMNSLRLAIEDLRTDTRQQIDELRNENRQNLKDTEDRLMDRLDKLTDAIRTSSTPWPSSRVA
jgi:gas vesicle protein